MLYRSAGSADYLCSTIPDDRKERDRNKSLGPPPWNRYRRQNPSAFLTKNPKRDNDRSPVGRPTRTRLEKANMTILNRRDQVLSGGIGFCDSKFHDVPLCDTPFGSKLMPIRRKTDGGVNIRNQF